MFASEEGKASKLALLEHFKPVTSRNCPLWFRTAKAAVKVRFVEWRFRVDIKTMRPFVGARQR